MKHFKNLNNFLSSLVINVFKLALFAVENIGEISDFLQSNSDKEEVKNFVKGFYSPDKLNPFFDTPEGLKVIQPRLDSHNTKAIESWKKNNLQGLIDAEVTKRHPGVTDEQKRIKKLEDDILREQNLNKRNSLVQSLTAKLSEYKLPVKLAKFFVAEDEDSSLANLNEFKTEVETLIQDKVKEAFKSNGRIIKHESTGTKKPNEMMNSIIRG